MNLSGLYGKGESGMCIRTYIPAATERLGVTKRHCSSNVKLVHQQISSHNIYRLEIGQRNARTQTRGLSKKINIL